MGLLQRIRAVMAPQLETRDALGPMSGFPGAWGIHGDAAGSISPVAAENLSAVLAAVNAISSGVASLAPLAFRRDGAGRTELPPGHWLSRLVRAPCQNFGWSEWVDQMVGQCCLSGNALAEIQTDGGGRVVALEPLAWGSVTVSVLPSGRVAYDIADGSRYGSSRTRRLLDDEVLHLRDRCDPGDIVARSRLSRAAGAVQNVTSLQRMSSAVWDNAMRLDGYISAPGTLTKEIRLEAQAYLDRFRGATRSGGLAFLPGGWKFERLGIDAETSQTLESRRFSTEEIARIWQISPVLLQDWSRSTFTNSETAGKWYGQYTISPWSRRLESAIQRAILGPHSDLSIELDLASLLKGSELERLQAYEIAVRIGAIGADEVRQELGWGPRVAPAAPAAPPPPSPADQQQEPTA